MRDAAARVLWHTIGIAQTRQSAGSQTHDWFATLQTAAVMLALAAGLRAFSYSATGLDWDESLYIVMAQRWLDGGVPYVAVWDQHPIGLPAIIAAATWLTSDGLMAARLTCLVAVAGTATLLARFLARYAAAPAAGFLAGLFYLFYMSRPEGLAANTEVFNNFTVTAASYLLVGEVFRRVALPRLGIMFAAGLLFGIGLQLKYVVFPEACALCCLTLLLVRHKGASVGVILRIAALMILGGLLPTAAATFYFWHAGALQPYLDANLRANVDYVGVSISAGTVLERLQLGLLPIIGLLPWPATLPWLNSERRDRIRVIALWLTVWLVAAAIDVIAPMKFWKHYFNALIPPLCLIAGLAVARISQYVDNRGRSFGLLVTVILLPALGLMIKHFDHSRSIVRPNVPLEIADRIQGDPACQRDVYVLNYDPLVYAYANAAPPTKYVLGIELSEFSDTSGAVPAHEISAVLTAKPCWIVVADPSPYTFTPQIWQMVDDTLQGYDIAQTDLEDDYIQPPITVRLYRRNDERNMPLQPRRPKTQSVADHRD